MKKVIGIYSCILLCLVVTNTSAQELKQSVISAGGGIATSSDISLEWTLGEPVVEVSTSAYCVYTQGFHQPVIVERKTRPLPNSTFYVSVAPNPVVSKLNVHVRLVTGAFHIRLADVRGAVVYPGRQTKQPLTVINMAFLKAGTYFLSIIDPSGNQLESFKVIKL